MSIPIRSLLDPAQGDESLVRVAAWQAWVMQSRRASGFTPAQCGRRAGVTTPQWKRWELEAPSREDVRRVAYAMECDRDEAMLAAGYAPDSLPSRDLLEAVRLYRAERYLHPLLAAAVSRMQSLSVTRQQELAELVGMFIEVNGRKA